MSLNTDLKKFGLNNSEVIIYLFLLENGLSTPPNVSRGTHITRTNCYHVLSSLHNHGLIEEKIIGKNKAYLANDPESLGKILDNKKEIVKQILPELQGLYTTKKNKPKIKFYEGLDQVKKIYRQSLETDEIMALGSTKPVMELMPEFLDYYFGEIVNRRITFDHILTKESEPMAGATKALLHDAYNTTFLPAKYDNLPTNLLIWENHIALITFSEPIFAAVLSENLLAETFKMMFDIIKTKD